MSKYHGWIFGGKRAARTARIISRGVYTDDVITPYRYAVCQSTTVSLFLDPSFRDDVMMCRDDKIWRHILCHDISAFRLDARHDVMMRCHIVLLWYHGNLYGKISHHDRLSLRRCKKIDDIKRVAQQCRSLTVSFEIRIHNFGGKMTSCSHLTLLTLQLMTF